MSPRGIPPLPISGELAVGIVSSKHLRRFTDISIDRVRQKKLHLHRLEQERLDTDESAFMRSPYSVDEFLRLEKRILMAAREGQYQVEALSFPAAYCTDNGRAINNGERDWPTTLQGKAAGFYDIWQTIARPKGYRLKAYIKDFPNGFPGDVSLQLDWS